MNATEIHETFARATVYEYPVLSRLILQHDRNLHAVKQAALLQDVRLYAAFDEVDWHLASIYPGHTRRDTERN